MTIKNTPLTTFSKMNEIWSSVNLGHVVSYKIFNINADFCSPGLTVSLGPPGERTLPALSRLV